MVDPAISAPSGNLSTDLRVIPDLDWSSTRPREDRRDCRRRVVAKRGEVTHDGFSAMGFLIPATRTGILPLDTCSFSAAASITVPDRPFSSGIDFILQVITLEPTVVAVTALLLR